MLYRGKGLEKNKERSRGEFEMRHYKDEDDEGFIDNLKDEDEVEDET